jgi:uncharacterized protein
MVCMGFVTYLLCSALEAFMSDTEITREDGPNGGRYVIQRNGETAEMTYSRAGATRIIIDHTGVPDSMRGLGMGELLVERAVQDARADGVKIIPLCPFAKAMLEKHSEWQDAVQ